MTQQDAGRPVAVVTGAARGIGAATALGLARAGLDLVLGDVPTPDAVPGLAYPLAGPADLTASVAACTAAGAQVATAPCDVRRPQDVADLVALAGVRLTAAVAVAGILGAHGPAWTLTHEELDRDLSVNLHGVANLARAAIPVLLSSSEPARGRFVAVVSSAGTRGLPRLGSYVASKHAALGYVRSLAADLAPTGITANAVLPGSTRTAMLARTAQAYGLDDVEQFAPSQRMGRLLEPAEIAAAVVWLCSAAASGITGTALAVDGGFVG
jgi:SDR family mycofactocin-dependent oxidoreductase